VSDYRLNRLNHAIALATLTVCAFARAGAQATAATGRGDIHGIVVNSASQTPVGNAEVDIMIGSDSLRASHVISSADGRFTADGLPPGRYRVRIRALGYAPKIFPSVSIPAASLTADVGTVALTAVPVELQHVVVRDQKQDVELAPDRNTYVVRDMPTTRGGSAIDVLRTVPSVDVDIDNIVSLRGNSAVVLQINGRPSPLKPAQVGNYLAQLPAAMVDKVEVVPNPSAKDDPEGVAGIINIVLKKQTDAGTSGGLTVSGGTTGRADIGGNAGYQNGPLTLFGSYGFVRDSRPRTDSIYRENFFTIPLTHDPSASPPELEHSGAWLWRIRRHRGLRTETRLARSSLSPPWVRTHGSRRSAAGCVQRLAIGHIANLRPKRARTGKRSAGT
jgi:hypothetical protein